jgi:hypothetical protein
VSWTSGRHIHVGPHRVEVIRLQRLISVKRTFANIYDAGAKRVEAGVAGVLLDTQFGIEHRYTGSQNSRVEGDKPTQIDVDPLAGLNPRLSGIRYRSRTPVTDCDIVVVIVVNCLIFLLH